MDAHVERVSELTKLARLIGEIRFGLLTTIAEDGSLWSRPISTQRASPEGEVWFFVKDDAPIAKELRRHSRCVHLLREADRRQLRVHFG